MEAEATQESMEPTTNSETQSVEEVEVQPEVETINALSMSDEEFVAFRENRDTAAINEVDTDLGETETGSENEDDLDGDTTLVEDDEESPIDDLDDEVGSDDEYEELDKDIDDLTEEELDRLDPSEFEVEDVEEQEFEDESYELYNQPIKANGRTYENLTAEQKITLIQKGLNYDQKMTSMKPGSKMLKFLGDNNIDSLDDLQKMLDLRDKNPDAIKQLVQDSGLDIDSENLGEFKYKPTEAKEVSDAEVRYSDAVDDIMYMEKGKEALDIALNKQSEGGWDAESQSHLFGNPETLYQIQEDMVSGKFEEVSVALDVERATNPKIRRMSDLQAYATIAQAIEAKEKSGSNGEKQRVEPEAPRAKVRLKKVSNKANAGIQKTGSRQQVEQRINPLTMSNEEWSEFRKDRYS